MVAPRRPRRAHRTRRWRRGAARGHRDGRSTPASAASTRPAHRCVRCHTRYCNATCQHAHWKDGHMLCGRISGLASMPRPLGSRLDAAASAWIVRGPIGDSSVAPRPQETVQEDRSSRRRRNVPRRPQSEGGGGRGRRGLRRGRARGRELPHLSDGNGRGTCAGVRVSRRYVRDRGTSSHVVLGAPGAGLRSACEQIVK